MISRKVKIGTLNLQWLRYPSLEKRLQLCELINEKKLDILMVQEAQEHPIQECISHLNHTESSSNQWSHITSQACGLANSILSKYPITESFLMEGGHRSAVLGKIQIKDDNFQQQQQHIEPVVSIMCTHLDHRDETIRQSQINGFFQMITNQYLNKEITVIAPDILGADFNSLSKSDYTKQEWDDIYNKRVNDKWELPQTIIMNDLLSDNNENINFRDSLEYLLKKRFYEKQSVSMLFEEFNKRIDLRNYMNNNGINGCDEILNRLFFSYFKENWRSTCRFNTRIDYILCNKYFLQSDMWELIDGGFVDTIKTKLTDHKLYWCEFQLND